MIVTNKSMKLAGKIAAFAFTALILISCDKIDEFYEDRVKSGGGSDSNSSSVASSESSNNNLPAARVQLDAFNDFNCTANWANRDGGRGLTVGSGSGTCKTAFPGGSGNYKIELLAQTEREGQSPYRISINGNLAGSGKFPFSQGKVNCKCYKQPWTKYCPDVVMNLDAGTHRINPGDIIEYYGEEEYLCGKHGAYSKWRGMIFTPVN